MARTKKTEAPAEPIVEAPAEPIVEAPEAVEPEAVEPEAVEASEAVEPNETYVRTFTLPSASYYGTDDEIATYSEGVIREAQLLGLRPTEVVVVSSKKNKAEGTTTVVFRAE